jgi:hypothetical protein
MSFIKEIRPGHRDGRSTQLSRANGIQPQSQVIAGEDPADLAALAADYYCRFRPERPEHRALVDSLVSAEWLLRRFRRAEANLWAPEMSVTALDVLQHRIDSTQRTYERVLSILFSFDPAPDRDSDEQSGFLSLVC